MRGSELARKFSADAAGCACYDGKSGHVDSGCTDQDNSSLCV